MNTLQLIALVITAAACLIGFGWVLSDLHTRRRIVHDGKRKTRINAKAPDHGLIFAPGLGIQLNADDSLPEVIQIAPFGRWPTRDKKAVQVFNAESAEQIISWFDFWPRKIARLARLNAIKVWVGHPDFAPNEWPERIELGSIIGLSMDDKGLNARVQWNAEAIEHVKKHKFPSVAWDCEINDDGTETPVMLWSVGMWHKPNIKAVEAVINAVEIEIKIEGEDEGGGSPEAETEEASPDNTNPNNEPNMIKKIIAALTEAGIVKETDDENSILGAIGSLIQSITWKREETDRQAKLAQQLRTSLNAVADVNELPDEALPAQMVTEFNGLVTRCKEAEAQRDALRTAHINASLDLLIETGRVTKAEEEQVRTELNADPVAGLAKFLERPLRLNAKPVTIGGTKPAIMEARDRATRLNAWVQAYQDKNNCDYDTAFKASHSDPEMKAIHEAMKQADAARGTTAD